MKSRVFVVIVALLVFTCGLRQAGASGPEKIFKGVKIKTTAGVKLSPEDILMLEKRVKTYWDARLKGDQAKMFMLEDPDVIKKEKLTLTSYIQAKSPAIVDKSYEVEGMEILSPEKVRVYIKLDAFIDIPSVMRNEKAVLHDLWQKKQGQWYRWFLLNPFSALPGNQRATIKAKPYEGPVREGGLESGTKTEVKPKLEKVPGADSKKE
jgi:hypothetical protein